MTVISTVTIMLRSDAKFHGCFKMRNNCYWNKTIQGCDIYVFREYDVSRFKSIVFHRYVRVGQGSASFLNLSKTEHQFKHVFLPTE